MIRALLLLLVLLTGCTFDVGLEDIPCRGDSWCPSGAWCDGFTETEQGVCVEGERPADDDDSAKDDDDSTGDDDDSVPDDDDSAGDDDDATANPTGGVFPSEVFLFGTGEVPEELRWLELSNTTDQVVDLEGWTIQLDYVAPTPPESWTLPAGVGIAPQGRALLAATARAEAELGVENVKALWGEALTFGEGLTLFQLIKPDLGVSTVISPSVVVPATGASNILSNEPSCFSSEPEDPEACWCVSPSGHWGPTGGFGSPNEENAQCPGPLSVGEFVITEMMLQPAGESPGERQWIELLNVGPHTRGLTGAALSSASAGGSSQLSIGDAVGAGERVILGNWDALNDAVDIKPSYYIDLEMSPEDDSIALWSTDTGTPVLMDRVDMTGSGWSQFDGELLGVSLSLSPAVSTPVFNDSASAWCTSPAPAYGSRGDRGTPGAGNGPCFSLGDDDDSAGDDDDSTPDDDDTAPDDDDTGPDDDDATPPDDDDDTVVDDDDTSPVSPFTGLVITEILVNPAGDDAGREWFEVRNTTSVGIDLYGLEIGVGISTHTVAATIVVPGYASRVLGQSANPIDNGNASVDYGYGSALALEPDSTLLLRDGSWVVDEVALSPSTFPVVESASISLDPGATTPSGNDDGANWCITPAGSYGSIPTGQAQYGDPRVSNSACPGALPGGSVIFSEIQAAPLVTDVGREWIELYNTSDQKVSLFGWQLNSAAGFHEVVSGVLIPAQHQVVLAWDQDSAVNGGVGEVYYSYGSDLDLDPLEDEIELVDGDGISQDALEWDTSVGWPDAVAAGAGATLSLGADHYDGLSNDLVDSWCLSSAPAYGDGGSGTPGWQNDYCPNTSACAGVEGMLVITEVMRDSILGVDGEWVEVYNPMPSPVLLDNMGLSDGSTTVWFSTSNVNVPANSYAVLAANGSPALNGGVPHLAAYGPSTIDLDPSSGSLQIVGAANGCEVDAITWSSTDPLNAGESAQLNPLFFGIWENDDSAYWCNPPDSSAFGNTSDLGSPGFANDHCSTPWYAEPSFCVGGSSLNDYVAGNGAFQSLWETARREDSFLVAPGQDPSSNAFVLDLYGTDGVCDLNVTGLNMDVPHSSGPPYVNAGPVGELVLAASPVDMVVENATLSMELNESIGKLLALQISGHVDVEPFDASFCSTHGCVPCPVSGNGTCVEVVLSGGGGSPVLLPL